MPKISIESPQPMRRAPMVVDFEGTSAAIAVVASAAKARNIRIGDIAAALVVPGRPGTTIRASYELSAYM